MRIDLDRETVDTLTTSLSVDILNATEARKAGRTPQEHKYWSDLIEKLKRARDTIVEQTTIPVEMEYEKVGKTF